MALVPRLEHTSNRIVGVDAARALAILGMLAVHIGPTDADGALGRLYALPHGRASLLFVLIAGIGVTLLTRGASSFAEVARRLSWRALLLLPAGIALQALDHGANVILQTYAALFIVAILAHRLGDRALLALAAAAAGLGPLLHLRWHAMRGVEPAGIAVGPDAGAAQAVNGLLIDGAYPVITWVVPLLIGIWLGRRPLRATPLQARMVLLGGGIAVACYGAARVLTGVLGDPTHAGDPRHLVSAVPHSQMPLWLIGGTAAAACVVGATLFVVAVPSRWSLPLVATGQLALTVYVGHLLVLHAWRDAIVSDDVATATTRLAIGAVVILATATAWHQRIGRGPLEALLQPFGRSSGRAQLRVTSAPRSRLATPVAASTRRT